MIGRLHSMQPFWTLDNRHAQVGLAHERQHASRLHNELDPGHEAADLHVMCRILVIGSASEGNDNRVFTPGNQAFGVGRRITQRVQLGQLVQLQCCLL